MQPHFLSPPVVTVLFTNSCNLQCAHCYSNCQRIPSKEELSINQWIDFVDYLTRNKFIAAYFEGGEPLHRPGFLQVLQHSSRYMMTWLRTHGTLIDDDAAQGLKQAGLGGAFIDFMGATRATHEFFTGTPGSFDASCRGVKSLLKAGIDTRLLIILTRQNAHELNDVLLLAHDLGVAQVSILRLYPIARAKHRWSEFALSLDEQMAALADVKPPPGIRVAQSWHPHDKNCCWSTVTVNAHGHSVGCPYLRELVNYGNILETPLLESWRSDPLYRELRSGKIDGACGSCAKREGTHGGCRATAFAFTGRWDAPDPFCPDMNQGIDLRILPDWLVKIPPVQAGTRPHLPEPERQAISTDPGRRSAPQERPGSYRLVPGTRVREIPERDMCMVYTPATPALYALQDEAWLILNECVGRTREEAIESYVSKIATAGAVPCNAAFDVIDGLRDLQNKRIIEKIAFNEHGAAQSA